MRTDPPSSPTSPSARARVLLVLSVFALGACDVYDIAFLEALDAQTRDGGGVDVGPEDAPDLPDGTDGGGEEDAPDMDAADIGPVDAPEIDAPMDDAGTDAGPACPLKHPNTRPAAGTEGPDGPEISFALRDVIFDQRANRWQDVAYDIDNSCTLELTDEFLCTPPTGGAPTLDGDMGEDNSVGRELFSVLVGFDPTFESEMQALMAGGRTIVLRVNGWNGMDDDPRVDVSIGQAVGLERPDVETTPQWDGDDTWNIADTSFVSGDPARPLIRDDNAYVSGRQLVMSMPDRQRMVMPWANGELFTLLLTDAKWTGFINADATRMEQVILSGRYAEMDIGPAFTTVGICPGSFERGIVDAEIREDLDVRSRPGSGGPGIMCDALSVGLGFTGYASTWGSPLPPPEPGPPACP